jgi:dTDP-4-dehydrorhamnose reductase
LDFDVIVNCAAYTAVDKAESEVELAYAVNAESVKEIAEFCKNHNKVFIQISTDFIFDGHGYLPVQEDDHANPLSVYGASKLKGEEAIIATLEEYYIIRTSWVYSTFGGNFVKSMLSLMESRDELGIIYDQVGTPTYARDLARAIIDIIKHIANKDVAINAIRTEEYPTPATRPSYSVLDKKKIMSTFDLKIPNWVASLQECIKLL